MGPIQSLLQEKRRTRKRRAILKYIRQHSFDHIDLNFGPEGVRMPDSQTPQEHLYEAWALVGSCIQDAMTEIDLKIK